MLVTACAWMLHAAAAEDPLMDIKGKKVVFILASRNFRDEEFAAPSEALRAAGAQITVASSKKGPLQGMLGRVATADILVKDIVVQDYDAVIFVGGSGAQEYFDDAVAHRIAKEAVAADKVLGAICIAPATLANAGVLKGRKATCFPSVAGVLRKGGATVSADAVVRDGRLVTASGPEAAARFAEALLAALRPAPLPR
jgi:protease I